MNAPRVAALAAAALLGACAKAPEGGWSADEKGRTRDYCLTAVGRSVELEQARAYCDCILAKTIEQYPRHADAERPGADDDSELVGDACAGELGDARPAAGGGTDAGGRDPGQAAEPPRVYGEWQVEFVPRGPGANDADTWQAIGVDAHGARARLAYVCDAEVSCGFWFRPAAGCDPADEPAAFLLLFTLPNGRAAVTSDGRCLSNGAWAFIAADAILARFRDDPEAVKVGLRADGWDFSLDGATAAMAYCERAARERRGADAAGSQDSAAPRAR